MYWSITLGESKHSLHIDGNPHRGGWITVRHSTSELKSGHDLKKGDQEVGAAGLNASTPYRIKWLAKQRLLLIDMGGGLVRHISIKGREVFSSNDDPIRQCRLSWTSGARACQANATVLPDIPGQQFRKSLQAAGLTIVRSKMTGKILGIPVALGQHVGIGDTLAVIEAMKMENRITAPAAGIVEKITVEAASSVTSGQELMRINGGKESSPPEATKAPVAGGK